MSQTVPDPEQLREPVITVYASIGNSDDKLTQAEWAEYIAGFIATIDHYADRIHGQWFSAPDSPFQNSCVCFEIEPDKKRGLAPELMKLVADYGQESIAWAEATTAFIRAQS